MMIIFVGPRRNHRIAHGHAQQGKKAGSVSQGELIGGITRHLDGDFEPLTGGASAAATATPEPKNFFLILI